MAKLGHTLRCAATGPLPSLAIRGGPTPGGGCTPALLGGGPLSGHRAMGHWPPTGHLLAIRGGPTGPHWPQRGGHRREAFAPPLTGHPLATKGRERNFVRPSLTYGAPAPTGHLREPKTDLAKWRLWPPTPPPPTPADRGLRTGGLPTPRLTHWPSRPSPTPQTFGERWPKGRGGVFACKGRMATGARAHRHPFGDPLRPTPPTGWPPTGQKGTGHLRPTPGKGPGPRPTSVPTGH